MLKNSIRSRVSCDHLDDRVVFIKLIQVTVCQMLSVWFVETYRFIEKKSIYRFSSFSAIARLKG